MMQGIIYSLMRNYHRQNTEYKDYKNMATKLFDRHVARGWDRTIMKEWILNADKKIQRDNHPDPTQSDSTPDQPLSNKERLFLHFEYHKNDIPKKRIRAIYDNTCQEAFSEILGIEQLTIAYSRSKNVQDTITKARLHQAPGLEASTYFSGEAA